jgi:uncharacterized protein involved in type VI secretion and phage assembly
MNSSLLQSELDEEENGGRMASMAFGIVIDNSDPDSQGRVLVQLSSLSQDGNTLPYNRSCWARVFSLNKCRKQYKLIVPEVNDRVIVTFQTSAYDNPLIVGIIPKDLQISASPSNVHSNEGRGITKIRTPGGHEIFFDIGLENQLEIHTKSGSTIKFDDSNNNSKIIVGNKDTNHNNNFVIINTSNDHVSIITQKDLRIKARSIEIESAENMSLKSGSTMTINGSMVKIN